MHLVQFYNRSTIFHLQFFFYLSPLLLLYCLIPSPSPSLLLTSLPIILLCSSSFLRLPSIVLLC